MALLTHTHLAWSEPSLNLHCPEQKSMTEQSLPSRSAHTLLGRDAFKASNTMSLGDHIELSPAKVYQICM